MKNKSTKTSDNSEANRPAPVKIEDDSLDPELHRPVPFKIRDDMLALELRRRAEEINREKSALAGGNQAPTSLSPAEIYKQFHEIQVHQIELELQNEELRRIQLELKASQARYFDIYELAPVGYIILSYQDMIIEANLTASKLLGISRSGLAAYTFVIFILNADRHIYHQNWKRLVETGLSQSCELRLLRRGGSQFWAQVDMSAGLDADGKFAPRVVITDINERKQAQQAISGSEARFRALADTAPVLIWKSGTNALYDYFNQPWLDFTGRSLEQELGYGWMQGLHFLDYQRCFDTYLAAFNNRHEFKMEYRLLRSDGEYGWLLDNGVPRFTEDGEFCGFIGSCVEITDRKQIEQALRLSEERLLEVMENSLDAAYKRNLKTKVYDYLSPVFANISGYSLDDMKTLPVETVLGLIHADDEAEVARLIGLSMVSASGQSYELEYRFKHKNGTYRWFRDRFKFLSGDDGLPSARIGSISDITDWKSVQNEIATLALRNQTLLNTARDGIHILDEQGHLIDCNPAFCSMLGYSLEELMQMKVTDWDSQWTPEELLARISDLIAHPAVFETRHRRKDGVIRDVEINAVGVLLEGTSYLFAAVRDVTERKQAAEASLRSEKRFRTIIEVSPVPMALNDEHQNITYLNPAFINNFGFTREDIPTLAEWWPKAYPDPVYRQWVAETWQARLDQAKQTGNLFTPLEITVNCKDGTSKIVMATATSITNLFEDDHLVVLYDITDRKIAEEALRLAHWRLESTIEGTDIATWEWNVQTGECLFNEKWAQIVGLSLEELAPYSIKTWERLVFSDDLGRSNELLEKHFAGELSHYDFECWMLHKDGHLVWVHDRGRVMTWTEAGKPLMMYGTHADISERQLSEEALLNARAELEQRVLERTADLQAANAALEKASRAKDDFLAIMSHELRTPLTGILGLAQVMQYKTYGEINEKQMTAVQNIEKNGLHLLELINEILDFSRIQSGNLVLQPSKFTLESACSACIHMVESLAEKKHQELSFNISPYGIMVNADERRLRQVIINLLSNAIKFTPDGGRIQLIATGNPEQQQVCICVKDNGIGIHDEDLPRLFQPFQQLDMRLSRMYNGAGLGLSLVKNLTELHGGSVKVESEFGQGSTFSVILPWDPESGEA